MPPANSEPLNRRLERLRKAQGLTAKAVAQFGVPESTYREWEYGRGLKLPPFQKMSQVLAISVTELVTGDSPDWAEFIRQLLALEKTVAEIRIKLISRI